MHIVIKIIILLFSLLIASWIIVAVIISGSEKPKKTTETTYVGARVRESEEYETTTITKQDLQILNRIARQGHVDLVDLEAALGETRTELVKRLKKLEKLGVIAPRDNESYMITDDVWKLLEKMREKYPYS